MSVSSPCIYWLTWPTLLAHLYHEAVCLYVNLPYCVALRCVLPQSTVAPKLMSWPAIDYPPTALNLISMDDSWGIDSVEITLDDGDSFCVVARCSLRILAAAARSHAC